ncbi:MAG: hypothetical protein ACR2KT_18765 [Methylocella sp.]
MIWLPGSVFAYERIFEDDALSHDGGAVIFVSRAGDYGIGSIGSG